MRTLAPHAATDVYEAADDYDEVEFVRDANQHDWSQDYQLLKAIYYSQLLKAIYYCTSQNGWMISRLLTKS